MTPDERKALLLRCELARHGRWSLILETDDSDVGVFDVRVEQSFDRLPEEVRGLVLAFEEVLRGME